MDIALQAALSTLEMGTNVVSDPLQGSAGSGSAMSTCWSKTRHDTWTVVKLG